MAEVLLTYGGDVLAVDLLVAEIVVVMVDHHLAPHHLPPPASPGSHASPQASTPPHPPSDQYKVSIKSVDQSEASILIT